MAAVHCSNGAIHLMILAGIYKAVGYEYDTEDQTVLNQTHGLIVW